MKILHIDDSPEISKVFSDVLKTKNHDFESITDGKAGLGMVLKNQYDLILLDMCMPNYNGIDFLLDLKKEKSSEIQKTVIVSSLELDEHQTKFLTKLGVKAIKQKPISVQNLLDQAESKIVN